MFSIKEHSTPGKSHGIDETPMTLYPCDYCSDEYLSESETEVHRRTEHRLEILQVLENPTNVCKTCFIQLPDFEGLIKHIKSYHLLSSEDAQCIERQIFICDLCNQLFFNKLLLAAHITHLHAASHNKLFECPKCNKLKKIGTIWYHFQRHQLQSLSCCPICLTKLGNRNELKKHINRHIKEFICSKCGYVAHKKTVFDIHIATHKRDVKLPTVLNMKCSKYFLPNPKMQLWRYNDYQFGVRGMALPKEVHVCILCKYICTKDENMIQHIQQDHKPDVIEKKKHICFCGEEFFNNILLKQHIFKHKGNHRILGENELPQNSSDMEVEPKETPQHPTEIKPVGIFDDSDLMYYVVGV